MTGAQILFWIFAAMACGGAIAVAVSQNIVRMAVWLIVSLGSVAGLFFLLHADFVAATQLLIYVGGTVVVLIFGVMLTASAPFMRIRTSPADFFLASGIGALFLVMVVSTVAAVDWHRSSLRLAGLETVPADRFEEVRGELEEDQAAFLDDWYQEADDAYGLRRDRTVSYETAVTLGRIWDAEREVTGSPPLDPGQATTARPIGLGFLGLRPDRDLAAEGEEADEDRPLSTGYLLPFEIISVHLLVVLIGAAYLARAKRRADRAAET